MDMKIKKIILWPKDKNKDIREVEFELNKVNVISGWSATGKSAIIPIIDYCLGSEKCQIPVGVIRKKTEWFGIILVANQKEILLARKEPGDKKNISSMYINEEKKVIIPNIVNSNISIDEIKEKLNQMGNFTDLDFNEYESYNNFKSRPSFRDTSAFQFQPQHIIANPNTLFFKADTYEHREKLKNIFPYVLGAITNEILFKRKKLEEYEIKLRKIQTEETMKKNQFKVMLQENYGLYLKAYEFGLLNGRKKIFVDFNNVEENDYKKLISEFNYIIESKTYKNIECLENKTEEIIGEFLELEKEEELISRNIDDLKYKLTNIQLIKLQMNEYQTSLYDNERISTIEWISRFVNTNKICPFCGSESKAAIVEIEKLKDILNKSINIKSKQENFQSAFDKEIINLRNQLNKENDKLRVIIKQKKEIQSVKNNSDEVYSIERNIYIIVGRIKQIIKENIYNTQVKENDKVIILNKKINNLKKEINEQAIKKRLDNIINNITTRAAKYTNELDIERKQDLIKIDIKNLTLKVLRKYGKEDYLWEIGSGSNWMGYHVATLLALHEYFISNNCNGVPRFIIFDQPSQVYFPEILKGKDIEYSKENLNDIEKTKNIFKALSLAIKKTKGCLQIIITDHAPKETWSNIDNIHLVEEWREKNGIKQKLIPREWFDSDKEFEQLD
ncbi:DUF3732 domain-containing protein [Clostridium botulinum]|uniref:DUF3732 domain-containing protein n=1 Tax=Clostridium botulinum TaxID=1491 RepID=UPI0007DFC5B5|nr:DUF3732 domain-containing protein [Clostridium botulinum]KEI92417.1 hypothetical protein N491_11335 [Clostridium botulinum B2 275]NFD57567.1 DUF3732 domain-containing protein [Clostridium botulinum]